jgi:hypothetical protein
VNGDEPGVAEGELEVRRPVDPRERVPAVCVVEVVVPDDADVGDPKALHEPEVALVPRGRPRAREVSEVGEERRRRVELADLAQELSEDAVRRRVGRRARVAGDDEADGTGDRRALDPGCHEHVPLPGPLAHHVRRLSRRPRPAT